MILRKLIIVTFLTLVWIILVETLSPIFVISGVVASIISVLFTKKFLPLKEIDEINFTKLIFYPIYLIGEIFKSAFYVLTIVFSKERTDIVAIPTDIEVKPLRAMLEASITLTPGSLYVITEDDKINVLWLRKRDEPDPEDMENLKVALLGDMEDKLIVAVK
ncbi:MAG: Na+/H+ antiporter subunit E [Defluviitaleaceae bacterium]|nr:Na+/H+ antiporter subunit E [Defluviitaleaceae bacterium]